MKWTEKEIKYLKENYSTNPNMKEIIKNLKRSKKSIQHQAARLNLSRDRFSSNKPSKRMPRNIIDKRYYEKNKKKIYSKKIDRIAKRRDEFKKLLGGKCSKCGYSKCLAALEFHHNLGDKEGHVSKLIKDSSKQKALKEIKKCVLLCANCHREAHNPGS